MKPSEIYTIKILSPEDYENLPYDGAKESMGMSVMDTKTAYIRSTGIEEMDKATINHEFDELMQQDSPHEINGIRYKSGAGLGRIFGPIIGTIVGFVTGNPAIGAAVGAAISGGTQAHSQSVKPDKFGSGFGGIFKAGALGGLGAFGGSSLINAGRVAATNAAIAGGTGNTLATFGAGLKGAAGIGASQTLGSAVKTGATNVAKAAGTNFLVGSALSAIGGPNQQQNLPGFPQAGGDQFEASQTSSAFAPQTESALTRPDFDASISKLAKNAASQEQSVFKAFRGQTTAGNSAFNTALKNSRTSSKLASDQFLADQRKLGSTFA